MSMNKFERRRLEAQQKFEADMAALHDAERKEIERVTEPVISKIAKVAEEEARKLLEANPEYLDGFTFKKRDAAKMVREAILSIFGVNASDDGDQAKLSTQVAVESSSETPSEDPSDDNHDGASTQPIDADDKA
ncbi:hypothetical protein ACOI1H_14570 [Loktanella sp. DJP18]|uniref:hypothetical protein n=1 Tax=Loktanella sp. DJP18 TaxID=3409788 RepID=UPI003BB4F532